MKWARGSVATVTAATAITVVAVTVGYVVTTGPGDPVAVTEVGSTPLAGSSTADPASPRARKAEVWTVPPEPVTLTAEPTPTHTYRATPHAGSSRKPVRRPTETPTKTPTKTPTPAPAPPTALDFTLSSFNVLGSSHTRGRGGRPPGRVRAHRAAELVRRHGSSVVGFQELQPDQLAVLRRETGMEFWPGRAVGRAGTDNSLGWRPDSWVAVERHVIGIPYFGGVRRPMPYVRLRNRSTGLEAWFANFHNPASTPRHPNQQRFRTRATSIEIALANRLIRHGGGVPVFFTGDMNEHTEYFCRLTGAAPMVAARGGNHVGGCHPDNPHTIDWIFGSQGVTFSGYAEDRSPLVHATTDHPVIVARAHIVGDAPRG